jgi:hypothetical protein
MRLIPAVKHERECVGEAEANRYAGRLVNPGVLCHSEP